MRNFFLFLSRQKTLRRWMETSRSAQGLTRRFIAGRTLDDVLNACRKLNQDGYLATLDHLGENVTNLEEAQRSRDEALEALRSLAQLNVGGTISIKLTQFGLDLSDEVCIRNVEPLVLLAKQLGSRVEIDMESSEYTDRTLRIVEQMHERYSCIRCVLQAYLYRTEDDTRRMCRLGIPVRLCKGAYNEPASIAFPEKAKVDDNYIKLTRILLDEGAYPAIASHDDRMIDATLTHWGKRPKDGFEFQMLYGVRRDLQRKLAEQGFRMRLYVPYGDAWYPYFMRRLAERPANVFFIARNLLRA